MLFIRINPIRFNTTRNTIRGTAAEIKVTAVLYVLFALLFFPMMTVCTTGMRYLYCLNTAHKAAVAASLAQSFQTNGSATELSSVNRAQQIAGQDLTANSGIHLLETNTFIVTIPSDGPPQTRQDTPLARPAQPSASYELEVQLVAKIQPLIASNFMNAQIPGLNVPMTVTTSAKEAVQNTLGLTQ